MQEDTKESKAQKIAAARKKLKEYQKRGNDTPTAQVADVASVSVEAATLPLPPVQQEQQLPTGSNSSNLSEKSESNLSLNGHGFVEVFAEKSGAATPTCSIENISVTTAASYFGADPFVTNTTSNNILGDNSADLQQQQLNLNALQVLITEKAQLTSEVNKYRATCREKDLELEELRTQFSNATQRLEDLQQRCLTQQQSSDQIRKSNAELQHLLAQANANSEDQTTHLEELQRQLSLAQSQTNNLDQQFKEKCNELEMSQLRIRQLSDEATLSSSKDNRVETLTQTQFMYEQQIRDLQAMVQQLSQDKEQSNTQYQNYVQHLNSEVSNLNEKNAELLDECGKLQDHERQLINHISGLEREIQRNIARQDQLKDEQKKESTLPTESSSLPTSPELANEIENLKEKINDFEFERHEFQLKIKSQEDRLDATNAELKQKQHEVEQLHEHLSNVTNDQPDKSKLLATMESDKVAASRAVTQNVELKKQLDELEQRFVQLTNDKADLMNKLDAEEYANREMRTTYAAMEERLRSIDERFKFKDEEMIRLSHENMELTRNNLIMKQQVDRLQHYEVKEYSQKYAKSNENINANIDHKHDHHDNQHNHSHDHSHGDQHDHSHDHQHDHSHDHQHDHSHDQHDHHHDKHDTCTKQNSTHSESELCHEAKEDHVSGEDQHDCAVSEHVRDQYHNHQHSITPYIPTSEAVEKLQQRFTRLMSQVADLTDEKQRLEHLVLQLQSETETIGEYIALYQTQRRILKQREYEKAAQMQLLQAEREQMRDKITMLNNLVSSLGVEMPQNTRLRQHLNAALAESVSIEPTGNEEAALLASPTPLTPEISAQSDAEMALQQKLNSTESQQILTKIQHIISEIKENTREVPTVPTHTVDHLNCCLGKFEVV